MQLIKNKKSNYAIFDKAIMDLHIFMASLDC